MNPVFFRTPGELRAWFEQHHATEKEVNVGFYKKGSGKPGITWPESVDEALSVGWIDGIRSGVNEHSYAIRFTPRRTGSIWSAVNIRRVEVLSAEGRMRPAGRAAYAARRENRSGIYSYEQRSVDLVESYLKILKRNPAAWEFFQAQPPSYQRKVNWWVVSAKREETRLKRLDELVEISAQGRRR